MSLPPAFDINLTFLSDWHIGTGLGRTGTVDATVRRDQDNLPFVPAKSLIGVWRDACETVAVTFDRATHGSQVWQDWVTWIFGCQSSKDDETGEDLPVPAAIRVTPARLDEPILAAAGSRPALAQAAVVLRPGVRISPIDPDAIDTGTAADQFLRVEERALRGLTLIARVELAHPSTRIPEPAEILLRAGARMVEAIGGKRNRGAGRVAMCLPDVVVEDAAGQPTTVDPVLRELLALGVPENPPRPPAAVTGDAPHPYDRRHGSDRRTVRLVLRTLSPVVAGESVISNIVTSRDVIPGTALLGTVLASVRSVEPVGIDDVRVGDAVPAAGDPSDPASVTPSLPTPRVWSRSDKGAGDKLFNTLCQRPEQRDRAKPMRGRIVGAGGQWLPVEPEFTVSTHAVVDDAARRPTAASGGVYTYLGIAPNTLLASDIVLPAGAGLLLEPGRRLRFGRSRKDDFGLVEVLGVVEVSSPPATAPARTISVLCRSDVLLRGETLATDPSPKALAAALAAALGHTPETFTVVGEKTMTSVVRREGFAVAWGRPRRSQVALEAGSVVTCSVAGDIDPVRLAEIERDGIGERTAEGFGRVSFDPEVLTDSRPGIDLPTSDTAPDPSRTTAHTGVTGIAADAAVHPIEYNAWRRAIRRAATDLATRDSGLPAELRGIKDSRAQLGGLRAQLERISLPGGDRMVGAWLDALASEPKRAQIWEQALPELRRLLNPESDAIWTVLGLDGDQDSLVLGANRAPLVRSKLRTEAVTTALTEVLRGILHATDQNNTPEPQAEAAR